MTRGRRLVALIALGTLVVVATALAAIDFFTFLTVAISCAVGAFLIHRRPRNAVGWLVMAIGISYLLTTARPGIDIDGIVTGTAPWPDFMWQWLGSWAGSVGFVCYAAVAFVFPSGRLVQDRRTAIRVALIVALLVAVIPPALAPSIPVTAQDGRELRGPNLLSPLGGDGSATPPPGAVLIGTMIPIGVLVAGVTDLLRRYRRAVGIERLQMRWLLSAALFVVCSIGIGLASFAIGGPQLGVIAWLPALFAYPTVALAIGVAILRYRLYDIDRIVSRTLSWGLVTGTILALFWVLVVGLQTALARFIETGTIVVAISTLVAAALFQPIRHRIQQAVDRRFDRARYDGQRTAAAFADRLRIGVDLDALVADLTATADEAVRPTSASLWLLQSSGRSGDRP